MSVQGRIEAPGDPSISKESTPRVVQGRDPASVAVLESSDATPSPQSSAVRDLPLPT